MLTAVFGFSQHVLSEEKQFPPIPKWEPNFSAPISELVERMEYYSDSKKDFVIFRYGTIVILPEQLNDNESKKYALETLSKIYNYHPDMNPINMDDGNILVQYNHPAYNIVISSFVSKHMKEIRAKHLDALATDEVLITSMGNNKFDEFGMKALYGRTFMFMDAKSPEIVKIYRTKPFIQPLKVVPENDTP
jgi:hypothetical protein